MLSIAPATGTVTVGPAELLDVGAVTGSRPVWTAGAPPAESFECLAQLRAHGPGRARAALVGAARGLRVAPGRPVRGVAAGQAVVLYDDDTVIGSATVAATSRLEPAAS